MSLELSHNDIMNQNRAGKWYDFMGACDLHLINAPNFADESGRMLVDIRTKIRHEYSYIESAVLQIGEETLEVSSFGDYILNGVDGADLGLGISDLPIIYSHPSKHVYLFEVTVDGEEKIVLKVFKDMVSVKFENADSKRFHGSSGMMGDFETGELLARDGATIISDPNEFAAEWQVRHDEPMLFQSVSGPQHPQACELPDPTRTGRRRLGESIALEAAEKACAHWDEDTRDICVHDVIATGDLELASGGSF